MNVGKKIKDFRLVKGVTQETLAQKLGVTAQAVSRWETGVAMPDIGLLPALSIYFGVRIDDFFELSNLFLLNELYFHVHLLKFVFQHVLDFV